jgi:thiol-disulfide isomerase/thioredoxin
MLKSFFLFSPLLILTAALVSCGSGSKQTETDQHFKVFDITGKSHRSDEWIGKQPVVLNFWGTWCGPCRKEIPDLVRLYNEYAPKGIEILSLAVRDRPDRVDGFSKQYGMRWVMLMASRNILIRYRVASGIPQTIFLDKDGQEVMRFIGARPYETLKIGFEALLKD